MAHPERNVDRVAQLQATLAAAEAERDAARHELAETVADLVVAEQGRDAALAQRDELAGALSGVLKVKSLCGDVGCAPDGGHFDDCPVAPARDTLAKMGPRR